MNKPTLPLKPFRPTLDDFPYMRIKTYAMRYGDTVQAIYARRKKGSWLEGVHYQKSPDGNLWVNLIEVKQWIEQYPYMVKR